MLQEIREILFPPLRSAQFISVFGTSLLVLITKAIVKYITKLPVLGADKPDEVDTQNEWKAGRRAAHFEVLRIGVDLCFLGLVTFFAVYKMALEKANSANVQVLAVITLESTLVWVQILLLLSSVLFMGLFHSPRQSFWKGIGVPLFFGWLSVWVSAAFFNFLKSKGL